MLLHLRALHQGLRAKYLGELAREVSEGLKTMMEIVMVDARGRREEESMKEEEDWREPPW